MVTYLTHKGETYCGVGRGLGGQFVQQAAREARARWANKMQHRSVSRVRSTISGTIETPTLGSLGIAGLQPPLRPSRHQYLHSGKNRRTSLWRKVFRLGERPEESEGPQTMRWFLALPFTRLASLRVGFINNLCKGPDVYVHQRRNNRKPRLQ